MKTLFRFGTSIIVAILTATLLSNVVLAAGPFYITQEPLYYVQGSSAYPNSLPSSGCRGGSCRYLGQVTAYDGIWRWGSTTSYSNVNQWYAYDPKVGVAAADYWVWENSSYSWSVVMDQSNINNKERFVYIGYSDKTNSGEWMATNNGCIYGWYCGSLNVYWDDIYITTK